MIRLGLTGSIGMGKSTTADFFNKEGIQIYSADAQIHQLYSQEPALSLIEAAFPGAVKSGLVDRRILSQFIEKNPHALKKLEAIVHPLLREREQAFLQQAERDRQKLVVLDIPLLYETGAEARVDYVVVVSAPLALQRQRVLLREGMSEEKFTLILARQLPDEEKRRRADFIINTGSGFEATRIMVRSLCLYMINKMDK